MDITLETLCAAQEGNKDAQDMLMRNLYAPVYHFLLKRIGNNDIADELCQTVFLKCYQRLNHYNSDKGTVYTWVFTIARHTLFDHFKKHKDELLERPEAIVADDRVSNTEHAAEARIDALYIKKLLTKLDTEEADVVTLRAIDEMSYTTIAGIIDKNESATRKVYSRALAKLRALVAEDEHYAYE